MKLRDLQLVNENDVPDHIVEEVHQCTFKLGEAFLPVLNQYHPNIFLSAMTRAHVAMMVLLLTENPENLENAAKTTALGIIREMDRIIKILEEKKQ